MAKKKLKVTFEEWDYECGDGCCYEWGRAVYIDGEHIHNHADSDQAIIEVLQHLGYEVEVEYK
ncbi:MAG TPA: hypothetical protein VNR38_00795 [Ureibacillus sp.]|nr:hypothetical protein [Ureibacillus sp.]